MCKDPADLSQLKLQIQVFPVLRSVESEGVTKDKTSLEETVESPRKLLLFALFRKRFCSCSKRMFSKSALLHRHPKQELHHHRFFKAYLGFITWKHVRFFNASSASKKAFCSLSKCGSFSRTRQT